MKIKTGKYKGYEVFYANKGQIFPRKGWCLMKSSKSGKVKDIKYLMKLDIFKKKYIIK